jgi:hypothetical protein
MIWYAKIHQKIENVKNQVHYFDFSLRLQTRQELSVVNNLNENSSSEFVEIDRKSPVFMPFTSPNPFFWHPFCHAEFAKEAFFSLKFALFGL